jgi:hypothetical protein
MTEQEWLTATDPDPMMLFGFGKMSSRKLRLFGCACCRPIWRQMSDEKARRVINVVEQFADGQATLDEACFAWIGCKDAQGEASRTARELGLAATRPVLAGKVAYAAQSAARVGGLDPVAIQRCQARLLRDIVGNPFRPGILDRSWRTSIVTNLAQAIYEERQLPSGHFDKERMGVLADALEEAGCDNTDILGHLRGGGDHVRGCWAVDLILDKK